MNLDNELQSTEHSQWELCVFVFELDPWLYLTTFFSESPVSACFFPLQKSKKVKREKKRTHYEMREDPVLYGELVVLGTDGELPNGNRGRRRSRFQVWFFSYKVLGNVRSELSLELYVSSTVNFDLKVYMKVGHKFP